MDSSLEAKRRALVELRLRQRRAQDQVATPSSTVVALAAGGPQPAFFCVHASGGSAAPYIPLAKEFDGDRAFHALEAVGLHGGEPLRQVEHQAVRYLVDIRAEQPSGPYQLGGWSVGGMVALEMAIQLRERGEHAGCVVMVDTTAPWQGEPGPPIDALLGFAYDVAALVDREPPELSPADLTALPPEDQPPTVVAGLIKAGLVPAELEAQTLDRMRVFVANSNAYYQYQPRPYAGPVTLLSAADTSPENADRWRALLPGLRHRVVPGTHYSMLRPPHVYAVAAALRECLDDAA
ncbi:MAG: thioesterase domain-containing protein [Micromonosporaceae bacterium]